MVYSGTGTNGVDYTTGSSTVEIIAGQTGATFVLTGLDDLLVEGLESIVVEISGVLNAFEYGTQVQNLDILDDDIAQVLLSVDTGAMAESGGVATFTVYTSGDVIVSTGIVVDLIYSGTGTNGVDYTTGTAQVTIPALSTGSSFAITGINDLIVEGLESVIVEIS